MSTITGHVAALPASLRDAISTIRVDLGSPELVAVVSISETLITQHPGGLTSMERRPDILWPLPGDWDPDADTMALAKSGLVGAITVDTLRPPGDGAPRILITTHAGSDQERTDWWLRLHPFPRREGEP